MGFFSSVCSFVSSVASSIGGAVARGATAIASLGVDLASKVGDAIKAVGVSLGIISPQDNLDELGEKALISDKKPDDFDTISDYIDHLQSNVTIDKEAFESLSDKDLLARSAIGADITLKGINEKLGTVVTPTFMAMAASQELEAKEIIGTIKSYKENGLNTENYKLYIDDELDLVEADKHSDALVQAYQKLEPELTIEQIEDKVMELKP